MSIPLPFGQRDRRDHAGQDWPADRLAEARAVIADVAHHSDQLIRLACNVLASHGESDEERRDARALLFVIDARQPIRQRHLGRPDPEVVR
jgi:hypothetical protein